MKRFLTLIAFVAAISLAAQAQLNFGVKGGLNVSKLSLDKKVVASDNQVGWYVGPTLKFTIPVVNLGFDVAALYDQSSGQLEYSNTDRNLKKQSIQIPVNLRWGFGVGELFNIFIFVGPQFGFNVGNKVTDLLDGGVQWRFKDSNLSGNAGLGFLLMKHLQLSVNYNMAFGKTGEFEVKNAEGEIFGYNGNKSDAKMNSWQIALAYYF